MKRTGKLLLIVIAFAVHAIGQADDVWVLQGSAVGALNPAVSYLYTSDALLYNSTQNSVTIQLLGISNGALVTTDRQFVLSPGRATSIGREGKAWAPNPDASLWVTHLSVPPGVVVESRISVGTQPNLIGQPTIGAYGKISFPVFRQLQAAGITKIHLGTDLEAIPTRNNVAIYNAGDNIAHAHIAVHQMCDDRIIDTRDVNIAPNTIIQVTGLNAVTSGCTNAGSAYTYVAVTVDQPSLSWVSSLSNADLIKVVWGVTSSSP
jgi:hypothetical protein